MPRPFLVLNKHRVVLWIQLTDQQRLDGGSIVDCPAKIYLLRFEHAMLRRLAGSPVRGENYFKAEIAAGRVGPDQEPPRREFD